MSENQQKNSDESDWYIQDLKHLTSEGPWVYFKYPQTHTRLALSVQNEEEFNLVRDIIDPWIEGDSRDIIPLTIEQKRLLQSVLSL